MAKSQYKTKQYTEMLAFMASVPGQQNFIRECRKSLRDTFLPPAAKFQIRSLPEICQTSVFQNFLTESLILLWVTCTRLKMSAAKKITVIQALR